MKPLNMHSPFAGIDHQVFVVADLGLAIEFWQSQLGIKVQFRSKSVEHGVEQAFFPLPDDTFIELLAPTGQTSPIARIIEKQGEGLYVLAMKVADLQNAIDTLKANGATITGEGTDRVIVRPHVSGAPLIQLWPKDRRHRWRDNLKANHQEG